MMNGINSQGHSPKKHKLLSLPIFHVDIKSIFIVHVHGFMQDMNGILTSNYINVD